MIGAHDHTRHGDKIGHIRQVLLDDATGQPEFVKVDTGLLGTTESFVPVLKATKSGEDLAVPYTKRQVKDAPNVHMNGDHLSQDEKRRLYLHYGVSESEAPSDTPPPAGTGGGHARGAGSTRMSAR